MFKNDFYMGITWIDNIAFKSPKHLQLLLRSFFDWRSCGNCGLVPVGHSKLPPIHLGNANTNVNTGMFKNDFYMGITSIDSIAFKSPKHLQLLLRSFFDWRSCGNCGLVPVGHSKLPPINLGNANTNVNTGMFKNDFYVTWALPELKALQSNHQSTSIWSWGASSIGAAVGIAAWFQWGILSYHP